MGWESTRVSNGNGVRNGFDNGNAVSNGNGNGSDQLVNKRGLVIHSTRGGNCNGSALVISW